MNLGMARAVNSSAIRLWQLRKARDYYEQKTIMGLSNRDFYLYMIENLDKEIDDLMNEIHTIRAANPVDKE